MPAKAQTKPAATKTQAKPAATKSAAKPATKGAKKTDNKKKRLTVPQWKEANAHLFPARPKNFGIGNDRQHKRDLSRFIKMPLYVRIQRQRAVLRQRVKIPATINQFASKVLRKDQATTLFKLLSKYRPETRKARKERLQKAAAVQAENKEAKKTEKAQVVTYGLHEVVQAIERKRAKLVIIAHDVNPIELVVFLPSLCRKMNIPYVIVKNRSRLGYIVHKKNCSVLAFENVAAGDLPTIQQIVDATTALQATRAKAGGLILSQKTKQAAVKKIRALANTIKA